MNQANIMKQIDNAASKPTLRRFIDIVTNIVDELPGSEHEKVHCHLAKKLILQCDDLDDARSMIRYIAELPKHLPDVAHDHVVTNVLREVFAKDKRGKPVAHRVLRIYAAYCTCLYGHKFNSADAPGLLRKILTDPCDQVKVEGLHFIKRTKNLNKNFIKVFCNVFTNDLIGSSDPLVQIELAHVLCCKYHVWAEHRMRVLPRLRRTCLALLKSNSPVVPSWVLHAGYDALSKHRTHRLKNDIWTFWMNLSVTAASSKFYMHLSNMSYHFHCRYLDKQNFYENAEKYGLTPSERMDASFEYDEGSNNASERRRK